MFLKILFSLVFCIIFFSPAFAQTDDYLYDDIIGAETSNLPKIMDENFLISEFTAGLNFPTTMEFVGNDILVLQKNDGLVRHVLQNGKISRIGYKVLEDGSKVRIFKKTNEETQIQ